MRADALNLDNYPVRTEMTGTKKILTLHVCSTYKSELKEFLVDETLSQICSTDERKLKKLPVDENLSQIFSTDEDESKGIIVNECSTEEDESECVHKNMNKLKDAEYE